MHRMMDDYALLSPLRHKNNNLKMVIAAFGLLVGVSSASPIPPLFIALCMSFATVYLGKTDKKAYLHILGAPVGFSLTGVVIIAFFFGSGPELFGFDVFGYRFTVNTEGLNMAFLVLARTLGGMCCLFFLAFTTPMVELFSVLKAWKLPDAFVELSMLIYRYIFVFLDVAISIKFAQSTRLGYKDMKTSFHSLAMLSSTLFIRAWEQGEKLFVSMNSRCYSGKLTLFEARRPVKAPELVLTAAYFISVLTLLYLTKNIQMA
ncbi:Transmembrane component CbiQ of energizing module of cobalt ECF transporter [Methanosarcina siciliae T4/M]|uniref:Transmembrane component CbiQ of energizing module of cobalt ECF transporter n=2 Tax=Methanosarcina siciliae TaxID=38027 RepID=A0A0E3PA61_9EURY|nr:cobalt ECF transporter T component CbiQ [Methanosarcina siciliae]AKB27022.1 Transmembrane component CbiQ of energizing module of cobalt ECF transporter [Methanosarcina siciliae T4/M]AKB30987.1 Transmembrane component CbiQ of energizing module of cobalt ECF transporter [Methanosarcina siciliae HI350]